MRCHAAPLKRTSALILTLLGAMTVAGCGSPPSVAPLLEVAERAMREEASNLQADAERDAQWFEQNRQALKHAYQRDLEAQESISAAWVNEATTAYVAAREALVRQHMQRRQQRRTRQDNLRAAAEAVNRAAMLLQQRDALMARLGGAPLMRLMDEPEP